MKDTLTIRIDARTSRMLARVARLSRRTQSQVARDALRRQLAIELFDRLRERVLPFAESRGLLTVDPSHRRLEEHPELVTAFGAADKRGTIAS